MEKRKNKGESHFVWVQCIRSCKQEFRFHTTSKIHCPKAFQVTVMQHEPIVCSQTCYVTDKHPVLGGGKSGIIRTYAKLSD